MRLDSERVVTGLRAVMSCFGSCLGSQTQNSKSQREYSDWRSWFGYPRSWHLYIY